MKDEVYDLGLVYNNDFDASFFRYSYSSLKTSPQILKYDLYIRKNANVNDIKIKYEGHDKIFLKDGNLIVSTSVNSVTELNPYAYQIINFDTVVIACNYAFEAFAL